MDKTVVCKTEANLRRTLNEGNFSGALPVHLIVKMNRLLGATFPHWTITLFVGVLPGQLGHGPFAIRVTSTPFLFENELSRHWVTHALEANEVCVEKE